MAGFRNRFQDHRRLLEQHLDSQAAFGNPEHIFSEGLLERFSQELSDFKSKQKFHFGFSSQKDNQKL